MITQKSKKYHTPTVQFVSLGTADVITASVGFQYPWNGVDELGWGN